MVVSSKTLHMWGKKTCVLFLLSFAFIPLSHCLEDPFHLNVSLTTSTNTYQDDDPLYQATLSAELFPSYQLTKDLKLKGKFQWDKDLDGERSSKLLDGYVGLDQLLPITPDWATIVLDARAYLPLEEEKRKITSLITRILIGPNLILDFAKTSLSSLRWLSLSYQPFVARDFYRYETSKTGTSNTLYTFGQNFTLGLQPSERISIAMAFAYNKGWTHERQSKSDTFEIAEEISYSFPKDFAIGLGHSNSGPALEPDRMTSNVRFYDDHSSQFYVTASKKF